MQLLLLSLILFFGLEFSVARAEPLDSWRIEIEKTNRFERSREYRVGGPRSLTWVYESYERKVDDPWSMKLGKPKVVAPWPTEGWVSEVELPRRDTRRLDPTDEGTFRRQLQTPLSGAQVEAIPGHYSLEYYVYRLVDQGRLPKRVRIEYEQTEYRGICTITVLEWGEPNAESQNYVAEPSSSAFSTTAFSFDSDSNGSTMGEIVDLSLLSIDGIKLGMASREVLALWRKVPSDTHASYDANRGVVVSVRGDAVVLDGHWYRAGDSIEPLLEHSASLGFEEYEFPISDQFSERAEELRNQLRAQTRLMVSQNAVLSFQLDAGTLHTAALSGGSEDIELHDGKLDWIGPEPTIHGVSLKDSEEAVFQRLGPPNQVHRHGEWRTLCYNEEACNGSEFAQVNAHLTFQNGRCRQIQGDQFEQAGQVKLGAGFPMPPPHSLSEVRQALSFHNSAFASRPAEAPEGPVTVAYNTDLGMQVWIYPDGRRQFLLKEVELPETIIDLEYP